MEYLVSSNFTFFTHKWIEYETLSRLKKLGLDFCYSYNNLISKLNLRVFAVTDEIQRQALEIFWSYQDKTWSIIDCVSISILRRENCYYVFSSDHHFREANLFPLILYNEKTGKPEKTFRYL